MADFPVFEPAQEWASSTASPLGDNNAMASESRAKYLEMTTVGAELPPMMPGVEEIVRHYIDAEHQRREAAARAAVVAKVREAVESAVNNGEYGDASGHLGGEGFEAIAAAAAEVFVGMVKNPPAFVTYPDGHTEIEWPEEEG